MCGELIKYWVDIGTAQILWLVLGVITIVSDLLHHPGQRTPLGNILPEVMAGVAPAVTAQIRGVRNQKARSIYRSANTQEVVAIYTCNLLLCVSEYNEGPPGLGCTFSGIVL